MPNHPAIEVESVTRTLKLDGRELRILRGLSFQVAAGAWVANAVSLAMLDRRYEIGVLKAIG